MTDRDSKELANVKLWLSRALSQKAKGSPEKMELYYIEAARALLSYAITQEGKERSKNVVRSVELLNHLEKEVYKTNYPGALRSDGSEEGIKILSELGISEPKDSKLSLVDVAGLDDVKEEIMSRLIYPIKYKDLSKKFGVKPSGSVLLYGPPGTGKTFIARAIANEVKATFINVNPSKLYSQWFGEFEKNISKLFKAAKILSPSVVFVDELESIASNRGGNTDPASKRGVSQLLIEMGGLEHNEDDEIFVLSATNRPWDIDEAMLRPGRFDILIYVSLPDIRARKKIFQTNLRDIAEGAKINYERLAELTEGYSGADIAYICRRSATKSFVRSVRENKEIVLSTEDIERAISEVEPSVTEETIQRYEKYQSTHRSH